MESIWPLAAFAFASSITPGPNNLMLAASGLAFGVRRTLPHMLGVPTGFGLLLIACGFGVGRLVTEVPFIVPALKVLGSAYLIYLTWTLRRAFQSTAPHAAASRPLSFIQAVLFQFVNPKAWLMALTAAALFLPASNPSFSAIVAFCAVFLLVNVPCIGTWVTVGTTIRRWATDARRRRIIAMLFMVLMAYTVVSLWI
jgi:threonine/homoserine/homoserine lactone efflux protein